MTQQNFLWIYGCVLSPVEKCENPLKQLGATVSLHGFPQKQQEIGRVYMDAIL